MNSRTVDVAIVADWTFMDDARLMSAIRRLCATLADSPDQAEDLLSDATMYLAVRPEKMNSSQRRILQDVKKYLMRIIRKNEPEVLIGDFERFMEDGYE